MDLEKFRPIKNTFFAELRLGSKISIVTPAVNPVYINLGDFDYAA